MKIKYDVISDVGRERSNNEDMALVFGSFIRDGEEGSMVKMDKRPRFSAIIADGMGGYGGGEIASEMTLRSFDQFLLNLPAGLDDTQVRVAVNEWLETHQNLILSEQLKPGLAHMGTTLCGLFTYEDRDYVVNAGDSRMYRFRNGELRQITEDHSERQRTGNPLVPSNLIYNAIGVPDAFISIMNLTDRSPMIDGDIYLMCSDGLSDMIDDETIASILEAGGGARELVNAALEAGGKDNCTVIVLSIAMPQEEETAEQITPPEEQAPQPEPVQQQPEQVQSVQQAAEVQPTAPQPEPQPVAFEIDETPADNPLPPIDPAEAMPLIKPRQTQQMSYPGDIEADDNRPADKLEGESPLPDNLTREATPPPFDGNVTVQRSYSDGSVTEVRRQEGTQEYYEETPPTVNPDHLSPVDSLKITGRGLVEKLKMKFRKN